MTKSPAFQFYPSDYLGKKVLRMSDASQGIYWRLICFMWNDSENQCSIENDDKIISKLLGISKQKWKKTRNEIQWKNDPILIEEDGFLVSKRLRKEKEKQDVKSNKARESANKRWESGNMRTQCERIENASPKQCSSSSTSIINKDIKEKIYKKENKIPVYPSQDYIDNQRIVKAVILHLNEKAGTKYTTQHPGNHHINERIAENITLDMFIEVIDKKLLDPKFNRNYMRPETLFSKDYFYKYLHESVENYTDRNGKPVEIPKQAPALKPEGPDFSELAEHVRKELPKLNGWFDQIKHRLRDKINAKSHEAFIMPLVISKAEPDSVIIHAPHDTVGWINGHYLADITAAIRAEEKMAKSSVVITGEVPEWLKSGVEIL